MLRNGLDFYALDHQPDDQQLGGTATQFPGKPYSRLDGYMKVMADGKAGRTDRAYALYRAINCFAPSQSNGCGPQEIPQNQRKQWFQTLKSRYGNTAWAKNLDTIGDDAAPGALGPGRGAAAGGAGPAGATVDAAEHDSFWLWAGVAPPPVLAQARTLYILQGQIDPPPRGGDGPAADDRPGHRRAAAAPGRNLAGLPRPRAALAAADPADHPGPGPALEAGRQPGGRHPDRLRRPHPPPAGLRRPSCASCGRSCRPNTG